MLLEVPQHTFATEVISYQDHQLVPASPMAIGLVQDQLAIVSKLYFSKYLCRQQNNAANNWSTDSVVCPNLDNPSNGSVSVVSPFYRGRANYKCNTGYRLEGWTYLICQVSGRWDDVPPVCISKCPTKKDNMELCTCLESSNRNM